jgi:adenylate kinase
MKDIILAWIQGCGKGTQAQLLLNKYGDKIAYFETGNILRALMSNDNAIWDYLKDTVNSGRLVSDNIITGLFKLFLETVENKTILWDWNLRKIGQTKGILHALLDKWRDPIIVLLEIPEEEVYKRLEHRKMCKECWTIYSTLTEWEINTCKKCWWELYVRTDDADINAIKTRIEEFKKETIPALEYVESLWHLVKIDWMQPIDEIFKQIEKLIEA